MFKMRFEQVFISLFIRLLGLPIVDIHNIQEIAILELH